MQPIFNEINTPSGLIRVLHEVTLGDLMIATFLALHLGFGIFKWITDKIWRDRQ